MQTAFSIRNVNFFTNHPAPGVVTLEVNFQVFNN